MDIKTYQKEAYQAIQQHESKKDEILNWAIGLSEEVGEVMNLLKHRFWASEDLSKEELAKEAGDVLWYLSALCTSLDVDLDTAAQINIAKLQHRHGKEFSKEGSIARHAKEEAFVNTEKYQELVTKLSLMEKR